MSFKVDNAIIMAAGTSSRFAPLSYEKPKALITVCDEVLIERQIRQIKESGISEVIVVTGYRSDDFEFLKEKFGVKLIKNSEYNTRNNHSSIYVARDYINNSYICSSDNYFTENPFETSVDSGYYSALYSEGKTDEWCLKTDEKGIITDIKIGGENSWYMLGHTFWDSNFSKDFLDILNREYFNERTKSMLWESIYMEHLDILKLKIKKYSPNFIFEFDNIDELRAFDSSYIYNSNSKILRNISETIHKDEKSFFNFQALKGIYENNAIGFTFQCENKKYEYIYETKKLSLVNY